LLADKVIDLSLLLLDELRLLVSQPLLGLSNTSLLPFNPSLLLVELTLLLS
jgi:hypothetical protein